MKGFFKIIFWIFHFSDKITKEKQRWKRLGPARKIINLILIILFSAVGLGLTYFTFRIAQNFSDSEPIAKIVYVFLAIFLGLIALGFILAEYELLFINAIAAFSSRAKKEKIPAVDKVEEEKIDDAEVNATINQSTTVVDANADKPKTSRTFDTTMGILYTLFLVGFTVGIFFIAAIAFQK